jgi:hypothetical protein
MPLLLRVLSASLLFISLLANAASLDVSKLQAGEVQYRQWHGMPVLVYKRTADEMSQLQQSTTKNERTFKLIRQSVRCRTEELVVTGNITASTHP